MIPIYTKIAIQGICFNKHRLLKFLNIFYRISTYMTTDTLNVFTSNTHRNSTHFYLNRATIIIDDIIPTVSLTLLTNISNFVCKKRIRWKCLHTQFVIKRWQFKTSCMPSFRICDTQAINWSNLIVFIKMWLTVFTNISTFVWK